jgi:hypothetical protein
MRSSQELKPNKNMELFITTLKTKHNEGKAVILERYRGSSGKVRNIDYIHIWWPHSETVGDHYPVSEVFGEKPEMGYAAPVKNTRNLTDEEKTELRKALA